MQIGGLKKWVCLFLIETMTSFRLGVPWAEPCLCGDAASLSSLASASAGLNCVVAGSDLGCADYPQPKQQFSDRDQFVVRRLPWPGISSLILCTVETSSILSHLTSLGPWAQDLLTWKGLGEAS